MSEQVTMTQEEMRRLAREIVQETLREMGLQVDDPIEMQRDFSHLRNWRLSVQAIQTRSLLSVFTILIAGLAGAVWLGIKTQLNN